MVSTSFMVDTSSHPRAQLHRCVERSAYLYPSWGRRLSGSAGIVSYRHGIASLASGLCLHGCSLRMLHGVGALECIGGNLPARAEWAGCQAVATSSCNGLAQTIAGYALRHR